MKTISNGHLTISVKNHGAELASVICNNREYLWQADPAFWTRHSPVLFPIVGAVWNGEYRSHGNTYQMGQHGFARDMNFTLICEKDNELRYVLRSNDDTLNHYPYNFRLEIGYRIENKRIKVMWHVENTGCETMYFQIGAHPAFFWPLLSDNQITCGVESMTESLANTDNRGYFHIEVTDRYAKEDGDSIILPISVITEKGCIGKKTSVQIDNDGYLPLNIHSFDNDALIIEDSRIKKVTICRDDKSPYLSLEFTSPLVGLWSPPGKRAPFVCIEPWYGRTDSANYNGIYEEKPWIQGIEEGMAFDASYDIIIE